jgi:hypothetical protein
LSDTVRWRPAVLIVVLLPSVACAAEDSVTRYRLAADPGNMTTCSALDPALGRTHTITVKDGDVEITSAGGIEGRMREVRAGVYSVVFELSGQRLDVVANLLAVPKTLSVTERELGCKWGANPEQ